MKTAEQILRQNGLQIGFKSTYDWEGIVKSVYDYHDQFKPKWIPVKDMLPENGKNILVSHYFGVSEGKFIAGKFMSRFTSEFSNVTHWMPLPDKP